MSKLYVFFGLILLLISCKHYERTLTVHGEKLKCELIHSEDFDQNIDSWVVEQRNGDTVKLTHSKLEIDDRSGCTVWFKHQLSGSVMIEYEVTVIDNAGPNDRVSDLNCFWMATDLNHPNDFFRNSEARNGRFINYHPLQLYYVGLGGHNNTKTRFRRYLGGGERPILPEHDYTKPEYLITANKKNSIRIIAHGKYILYYYNGELLYDFIDEQPYTDGYFGFRTVNNHLYVDDFKVYQLK